MVNRILTVLSILILVSCAKSKQQKLPYIGHHEITNGDTVFYQIPSFSFLNQDSLEINDDSLSKYIYVSDFFYSYCPTICPKVKNQMLRIYDKYATEDQLKFVSFALDPKRDDVEHLHSYAKKLGVSSDRWHFLTGGQTEIWDLAAKYLISVKEDKEEPGGIYHSGKILLIDSEGHIRSFAEGTEEKEVNTFIQDIDLLLKEKKQH